ncbi:MAG: ATP-binding protein [Sulfolobales archaeon]|nr:ATP-binding protein [Sulfolobales archaeon]MDW8082727.1 ATP-binding protein [Sulfolobales archaeon]
MKSVGVIASGSRSFYAPILIYKEAEKDLVEEALAVVRDRVTRKEYLGIVRGLSKIDPLLPATQRSGVVDNPKLAEVATSVPFENSYIKILGELRDGRLEPPRDPPTPRSEIYLVESPEDVKLDLGQGLAVGSHKYSDIEIPLVPIYLPYHIGIVGATGTGKSRLVRALVDEVTEKTDWKVLVFDHSGVDYVPYYGKQRVVDASLVMPDPITLGQLISKMIRYDNEDHVVLSIYAYIANKIKPRERVKTLVGVKQSQQESTCDVDIVKNFDFTHVEKLMIKIDWDVNSFVSCIEEVGERFNVRESTIARVELMLRTYARKFVNSLGKKKLTTADIVDRVFSERLVVVDLSTVELVVRRYIVKSAIDKLWEIVDERGEKPRTLVVIDEAHNYACYQCKDSLESIERTAREGRKWDIGLALSSQRVIDFSTDVRNNVNTYFFSRLQTPGDFDNLKGVLDLGGIGADSISALGVREFFFAGLGNPLKLPILIKVREVGESSPAGGNVNN